MYYNIIVKKKLKAPKWSELIKEKAQETKNKTSS